MEADWEVEIGGGAAVIEAEWPGFVDLRADAGRVVEIAEAAAFPPLAGLLLALNAAESPVWTSKCDLWEPEPGARAIYIDMLPREGRCLQSGSRPRPFAGSMLRGWRRLLFRSQAGWQIWRRAGKRAFLRTRLS